MKKIPIILSTILLPISAFAEVVTVNTRFQNETDAMAFLEKMGNWLFTFAITAVPIAILIGAFMFVTAAGNPEKVKTGRKIIIWAIIGLVIIMMSKGIIVLVSEFLKP